MTTPTRVRLSRAKGFRLQEHAPGAIVVRRPTRWGNPFTVADAIADEPTLTLPEARERCTWLFDLWLDGEVVLTAQRYIEQRAWILGHVHELRGRPLACTCPLPNAGLPDWCHGAHLITRANAPHAETWSGYDERRYRSTHDITPAGQWARAL